MIRVYWSERSPHVIHLDYTDPIASWEEYHEAICQATEMSRSKPGTVYLLHNPGITPLPDGNPFPHLHKAMEVAAPNTNGTLMVISNVYARRIMELMLKIASADDGHYFVSTVDEAYDLLETLQERV